MWYLLLSEYKSMNGGCVARLGHSILDFEDMTDAVDFAYGVLWERADPETMAKLDDVLDGKTTAEGAPIPGSKDLTALDEFEKLIQRVNAEQD